MRKVFSKIVSRFRQIKLKTNYLKLREKFRKLKTNKKLKKVLKIIYLVKKLSCIHIITKNVYVLSRKTYYVLQYGHMSFWVLPNLVLRNVSLATILITQIKGVFKILVYFLPSIKKTL